MHYLLLSVALLLPGFAQAQTHDHEHANNSLDAHVHGEAGLDVALEGKQLELQLHSPAINLAGFERAPVNAREQARLNAVRDFLTQPEKVFALPVEAGCALEREAVSSELFGVAAGDEDHLALHDDTSEVASADNHHDIHAYYQFTCTKPQALHSIDLRQLFRQYPGLHELDVQLIGPRGQKGQTLNARKPVLQF
ncbi:MAG TPA: DUF2796 domain-containing protein [Pseudomonas sp.]|jgi:hypothetical protein|nr:DUF2796 domain-containing protein [Pseudomonas sp.]